ncbi:MAG: GNAT family N-acetyltransferase [Phycisphaeraceae bacterium]|nr:GNAT family N-acetyltransferase [Phycisphaeraceae bacterium]
MYIDRAADRRETTATKVMSNEQENQLQGLIIRTYGPADQKDVVRLYHDGLLAGQITPNDTGLDIENIENAYLSELSSHFWTAHVGERMVGMIGVVRDEEHVAEIRRLRVDKEWQKTSLASQLIETALAHCRQHGYLKVVLDTRFERQEAVELFERFGFQHTRTRAMHEKELLEFYLDIYRHADQEKNPPRK